MMHMADWDALPFTVVVTVAGGGTAPLAQGLPAVPRPTEPSTAPPYRDPAHCAGELLDPRSGTARSIASRRARAARRASGARVR